jgi:hypothetical protein
MLDYYNILGVSPTASPGEIKFAFRKLAKQYHPDKVEEPCKQAAEDTFKRIAEAYYILEDPSRRCEYDLFRTNPKPSGTQKSASAQYDASTFHIDDIIGHAQKGLRDIDRGTLIVRFVFGAVLGLLLGFSWLLGSAINSPFVFCLCLLMSMLLFGSLSTVLGDKFWLNRFIRWIWWF